MKSGQRRPKKVTFRQRPESSEGMSHKASEEKRKGRS